MSDRELEVAGVANETLETMIIASSESLSFHGSIISAESIRATHSGDEWGDVGERDVSQIQTLVYDDGVPRATT